ncbi:MAG: hypothetical protein WA672_13850 [Candidatus Angelobacter sp.]
MAYCFDAISGSRDTGITLAALQRLASYYVESSEMAAKGSRLFLVKSAAEKMADRPKFRTDGIVPQSGIYKVRHRKHRLPHEVSLFRDQRFPRCAQCQNAVVFELLRGGSG